MNFTGGEQLMIIKYATTEDIAAIAAVEAECFPPAEAATAKEFVDRVKYYGNHFRCNVRRCDTAQ